MLRYCTGLFSSYSSLVIDRNESISDEMNRYFNHKTKFSSLNDE